MTPVIERIGTDSRCAVHQCLLGMREGKEGWFHVVCPSSAACSDDGSLWASIVSRIQLTFNYALLYICETCCTKVTLN